MKNRNPILVFVYGLITFGIYSLVWAVKTKGEMNQLGEKIPTAWIILIPLVGPIWFYWAYSQGVGHITQEKMSAILAFILLFLLGAIGEAIIQDSFNNIAGAPASPVSAGVSTAPGAAPTVMANPNVNQTSGATPITPSAQAQPASRVIQPSTPSSNGPTQPPTTPTIG